MHKKSQGHEIQRMPEAWAIDVGRTRDRAYEAHAIGAL